MHTYRDILKAKAEALMKEAQFGADETIKLVLQDLTKFAGHIAYKTKKNPHFHLGQDFYEVLADDLEAAAERDRAEASLRLRNLRNAANMIDGGGER